MKLLVVLAVWSLSFFAASKSFRSTTHDSYSRLYGIVVALIPVLGPLAYFVGFEAPPPLPSGQRSPVSNLVLSAKVVKDAEGESYVAEKTSSMEGSFTDGMPPAGQIILKTVRYCFLVLLSAAAIGGNYALLVYVRG